MKMPRDHKHHFKVLGPQKRSRPTIRMRCEVCGTHFYFRKKFLHRLVSRPGYPYRHQLLVNMYHPEEHAFIAKAFV